MNRYIARVAWEPFSRMTVQGHAGGSRERGGDLQQRSGGLLAKQPKSGTIRPCVFGSFPQKSSARDKIREQRSDHFDGCAWSEWSTCHKQDGLQTNCFAAQPCFSFSSLPIDRRERHHKERAFYSVLWSCRLLKPFSCGLVARLASFCPWRCETPSRGISILQQM